MHLPFAESEIPRWWFHESPSLTMGSNGINLLFPKGEQFFIRSVKHYLGAIQDDPELCARVRAFFGQEGRHGHEHERFNRILEAQGFDLSPFFRVYDRVAFGFLEPAMPPAIRLATTVALEHLTATMADNMVRHRFVDGAHPTMKRLLMWHAAEEIEHKSVAFDVFTKVDGRYWMRALGLFLGLSQLLGWWAFATSTLMKQERAMEPLGDWEADAERQAADAEAHAEQVRQRRELFRGAIADYLRRDFHPDDNDNYHFAESLLREAGAPG